MEGVPESFLNFIPTASNETKMAMIQLIQDSIQQDKADPHIAHENIIVTGRNIDDYLTFIPDFNNDKTLWKNLTEKAIALDLIKTSDKVQTQFLNFTPEGYKYGAPDHEKDHKSKPLEEFEAVQGLMKLCNDCEETTKDADCCLVSVMNTAECSLSLHADDEYDQISQTSSICTFTIGATSTMDFCSKRSKTRQPTPITTLELTEGCLTIMKPGCQQVLRHRINKGTHKEEVPDLRINFSFRKYIPCEKRPSTPIKKISDHEQTEQKLNVCLVAGDSHSARLDTEKLGKGRKRVINISRGGSTIKTVEKSLKSFADENLNVNVKTLIICVGTNDVLHTHHGVRHITTPYTNLLKLSKTLFPDARIFCQSLLPLPVLKCSTVTDVRHMNNLIYVACTKERVFYLDVFDSFLNNFGYRNEQFFPRDIRDIHLHKRGMVY